MLLDDLAKSFCTAARGCCNKKNLPTTLTDCEAQFPSRLRGLDYVKRGTETIDNAALARCVAGYKETLTTCAFQPLEAACKNVFVGTKAEGAACGMGGVPSLGGGGECKHTGRSTECLWTGDSSLTTTTGVCFTPAHAKKGETCGGSCGKNEDCVWDSFQSPDYPTALCFEEDGLHCATGVDPAVCVPIVPTGGNCDGDPFACASTDRCGIDSVCVKAPTLGQSCSGGASCAWGMSLFCSSDSNKCEDLGFAFETTCAGEPPFP